MLQHPQHTLILANLIQQKHIQMVISGIHTDNLLYQALKVLILDKRSEREGIVVFEVEILHVGVFEEHFLLFVVGDEVGEGVDGQLVVVEEHYVDDAFGGEELSGRRGT